MNYNKRKRSPTVHINKISATYSVESHDKWASRYIWALDQLHKIHPPSYFLTVELGKVESNQICNFRKKLRSSISNKKFINKEFSMAYFGVPEILMDCSVHIHMLFRGFNEEYFYNFLTRYNKKNSENFSCTYNEATKTAEGASRYSFKLGYNEKIMFGKNSLSRYTITGGGYFPEGIRHYRNLGRKNFYVNVMQNLKSINL